jgi:hypothetical protein
MGFVDTKANAELLLDPTIENSSRFRASLRKCGFQSTELNQAKPDRPTSLTVLFTNHQKFVDEGLR